MRWLICMAMCLFWWAVGDNVLMSIWGMGAILISVIKSESRK